MSYSQLVMIKMSPRFMLESWSAFRMCSAAGMSGRLSEKISDCANSSSLSTKMNPVGLASAARKRKALRAEGRAGAGLGCGLAPAAVFSRS
jgi:hypothetical protein